MHKVLVVSGGLINAKESSLPAILKKEILHTQEVASAWLEYKIKAVAAEPILASRLARKKHPDVQQYFAQQMAFDPPELTEVVLMGLLRDEGIPFEAITYHDVFANKQHTQALLASCTVVFMSATLLHDLSELMPLVRTIRRPHHKIVVGGALAGSICHYWAGAPEVDVLAVGYGEMLVPALAKWIKSNFQQLEAPTRGRLVPKNHTVFLHSGAPETHSLDFLPTPDWALAAEYHQKQFPLIYYESVRGCPYRCSFCNYPYLFDDKTFRTKSAQKMADDWTHYVQTLGVEYIVCLDSLFTLPPKRLVAFCNHLIERNLKVKWICYARADDMADPEIAERMAKAGCIQVQIGIESGDQQQLDNMNKQCTVEANYLAIENCRKFGIATVVSLVVGYPGETRETIDRSIEFILKAQPDFYFLATFSTRVDGVPVLRPDNKARFGLRTMQNALTFAPYWVHDTMSCAEVGNHVRRMNEVIMAEKAALEGAVFYGGILQFRPQQRQALLEFQQGLLKKRGLLRFFFDRLNRWIDRRLSQDLDKQALS